MSKCNYPKKKLNKNLKIMLLSLQIKFKSKFYKISKIQTNKPRKKCTVLLMTLKTISKKKQKLLFNNKLNLIYKNIFSFKINK